MNKEKEYLYHPQADDKEKSLPFTVMYVNIDIKQWNWLIILMSSQRPLSPHLQIYRPQITSLMSIAHRLTGIILSSSLVYFAILLTCLMKGVESYTQFYLYSQYALSQVYLFVLCGSFYYHLCNGIRHLFWDGGYGFDMAHVRLSGYLTLGISVIMTLITWFIL